MNPPFLSPFDLPATVTNRTRGTCIQRTFRAFNVRLNLNDERPVGYVVENTTLEPDERPWSAFRYRRRDGHSLALPGHHETQEEALRSLLATVGGT